MRACVCVCASASPRAATCWYMELCTLLITAANENNYTIPLLRVSCGVMANSMRLNRSTAWKLRVMTMSSPMRNLSTTENNMALSVSTHTHTNTLFVNC